MQSIRDHLILVIISATLQYVQGAGHCALKFPVDTGHYCFKYIREAVTYSEATETCSRMGAVVAHPAAQDWDTWRQAVRAVTRNDHSLWVGTERTKKGWYWLNTGYDGKPLPINYNTEHQDDFAIPKDAWGWKSDYECVQKFGNETVENSTLADGGNSTDGEEDDGPKYCKNKIGSCVYFDEDGKLNNDVKCNSSLNYVLCQGPKDYTSACENENCTDNAYHFPISWTLCGCKCRDLYIGDGYNDCRVDKVHLHWMIFGIVVGCIIFLSCCCLGVRKQMKDKPKDKKAVKKAWCTPCLGCAIGFLIIWLSLD